MFNRSHRTIAAAVTLMACTATGCSFSAEVNPTTAAPTTVPAEYVAGQTKTKLTEQFGVAPDTVTCDGGLRKEVGATQRCTLTRDGDQLGMTLTATKVNDNGTVDYDVKVDQR